MTTNTIAYANYLESNRHNLATEQYSKDALAETTRHAKKTETISWKNYQEAVRHNKQAESIDLGKLNETTRSNKANESIKTKTLAETIRSDKANESIKSNTLSETIRHDKVVEQETAWKNQLDNTIDWAKIQTETDKLAQTARIEANKLSEQKRHNMTTETFTSRELEMAKDKLVSDLFTAEATRKKLTSETSLNNSKIATDAATRDKIKKESERIGKEITKLTNDIQLAWKNYELAVRKQDHTEIIDTVNALIKLTPQSGTILKLLGVA